MEIRIEPLTENNMQDFFTLMESVDFQATPHWSTCFCRFYYTKCSMDEWKDRTGATNKQEVEHAVRNHEMHGFLAFVNERPIGWVNAADVRLLKRLDEVVKPYIIMKRYAATICFVIHNEFRGRKVATKLLEHAMLYYKSLGFDGMLAMPFDHPANVQMEYRGPFSIYQKFGYVVIEEKDQVKLMKYDFLKDEIHEQEVTS